MLQAGFCAHHRVRLAGAPGGPLAGATFAAKDLFAVEGVTACFGNPTWLATHAPAARTAPAVASLLRAGATLVGLTVTDELALSLTGENAHYGTPMNSRRPDRVPGGSSSGSAAAVASGACAFALGTDTGGSVRVPSSHCGLYGFRPTHGAVSAEGVLPLAPRFDTVGWFARDARTLARVGDVLLGPASSEPDSSARLPVRLLTAPALARLLDPEAAPAFAAAAAKLAHELGRPLESFDVEAPVPARAWLTAFLALQNAQLASAHGPWIQSQRPTFGSLIAGRIARALAVTAPEVEQAEAVRDALMHRVGAALAEGDWFVWPSAAGAAPPRGLPDAQNEALTARSLTLSALASLCGLPQISLPHAEVDGCPFGISLIGPRGSDRKLLAAAARLEGSP